MPDNKETSSAELAGLAGQALQDPGASDRERRLAGSVLTQFEAGAASDAPARLMAIKRTGDTQLSTPRDETAEIFNRRNPAAIAGFIEKLADIYGTAEIRLDQEEDAIIEIYVVADPADYDALEEED